MTLRNFLDAGYALLLEDALRIPGVLLEQAMEMVSDSFKVVGENPPVERGSAVPAQNTAAINQLEAMLAGVKR